MVLISIPTTVTDRTPTFATCVNTKETVMLEFQGMMEMDGTTWAGNALGQLSILDGGVKAQLVVGNHRLDGKVVMLDKPLLLIQKQQKPKGNQDTATTTTTTSGKIRSRDYGMDNSSQMNPAPPHDDDDTMHSTTDMGAESTTTTSIGLAADPLAASNIRDTLQYDTVAVIRQKILFNLMPVPIIHHERRGLTVIKRGV